MKFTNTIIANNKNKSYFPDVDKLPKIAVDYVRDQLLSDCDEKTKELFFIIRKSQEININKYEGKTPIPYKLIRKKGYIKALEKLKSLNLVEFTSYSKLGKQCRSYWINWDIYENIESLIPSRAKDFSKNNWKMFNGITNKAIRNRNRNKSKHKIYKYDKRKKKNQLIVSDIVANGIIPIKQCTFDYIRVENYLNSLRELYKSNKLTTSKKLKYLNNERCYRSILLNGFELKDNLLTYKPRYRAQKTGRRSEIGGGFQSCSREIKHEAFADLPDVRNYDLKSSQMYGLKYAFMSAGYGTDVVENTLE